MHLSYSGFHLHLSQGVHTISLHDFWPSFAADESIVCYSSGTSHDMPGLHWLTCLFFDSWSCPCLISRSTTTAPMPQRAQSRRSSSHQESQACPVVLRLWFANRLSFQFRLLLCAMIELTAPSTSCRRTGSSFIFCRRSLVLSMTTFIHSSGLNPGFHFTS